MRYFHVAPSVARAEIEAAGLDYTQGESAYQGIHFAPGNYLFTDEDAAVSYQQIREEEELAEYGLEASSYDVWEVQTDAKVHPDQFADDESGLGTYSVFTTEAIAPSALRLMQ